MQQDKAIRGQYLPAQYRMRFYESQFPQPNELVMAEVKNSEQNGCYVYLIEYDNKQGMIPLNEYSKLMTKSIHRVMKTGKKQILRVIRVDKEKGYIDLSKKQIYKQDQKLGEQKYANASMIHSILIHISEKTKVPVKELYETIIWPLYKRLDKHPLIFLKSIMLHEEKINELNIKDENIKSELLNEIKRRFKTSILKTMAEFSVQIKSYEGVNDIKKVLQSGVEAARAQKYDVNIAIVGAPKYMCHVETPSKETGKQALSICLNAMKKQTAEFKGDFKIDREPRTVGDINAHMQDMIRQEQLENQAGSGDQLDEDQM